MCEYKDRRKKTWLSTTINIGIVFLLLQVTGWAILMYSNQNKLSHTQEKIVETLNRIHTINKVQEEELRKFSLVYTKNMSHITDEISLLRNKIDVDIEKINNRVDRYHDKRWNVGIEDG